MSTPQATPPVCDVCGQQPATRTWADIGQHMCAPCAVYAAGQQHGAAIAARDALQGAVGALLDADVSGPRIEAIVRAFVDQDVPPVVAPRAARERDPRPWTVLLQPLNRTNEEN